MYVFITELCALKTRQKLHIFFFKLQFAELMKEKNMTNIARDTFRIS